MWFHVWKSGDEDEQKRLMTDVDIDAAHLNICLSHVFYYESLPHFAVQIANNTLLNNWNSLSIVSISFSVAFALNGIYSFLWYRFIAKTEKRKNMEDIPIDGLLVWSLELVKLLREVSKLI